MQRQMARRTERDQILWLIILRREVGVMNRKSQFRPLGAGEMRGLLSWTQAQPLAVLTTPTGCFFSTGSNFTPVLGVTLAVDGHGRWLSLFLGVTTSFQGLYPVMGVVGAGGWFK